MKVATKNHKPLALFLIIILFFQGCIVYKSTPVTLAEASNTEIPVRIENTNGKKVKLLKVEKLKDGNYYGKKNEHGSVKQILLNEDDITKVELKDKKWSTINSIAAPIVVIGILIFIVTEIKDNISVSPF